MKIVVEAIFDSFQIEQAIMLFDNDRVLFNDILDFMDNHKSVEYVSLNVEADYVSVSAGKYHTVRRQTNLPEIQSKSYSTVTLSKKKFPFLKNAKIYVNRYNFYFYGEYDGVIYQSYDITRAVVNEWCMEMTNV